MTQRDAYHHGDLRKALISAGEELLQETGIDRFSLRAVARKVGVSHSAPAHHFGDANGLLAGIAAEGFRRLLQAMETQFAASGPDPREAFIGSGVGYILFAESAPATFELMFGPARSRAQSDELEAAAQAAYEHLACNVESIKGRSREADPAITQDILACWGMVHGLSDLLIKVGFKHLQSVAPEQQIHMFRAIIERVVPSSTEDFG